MLSFIQLHTNHGREMTFGDTHQDANADMWDQQTPPEGEAIIGLALSFAAAAGEWDRKKKVMVSHLLPLISTPSSEKQVLTLRNDRRSSRCRR